MTGKLHRNKEMDIINSIVIITGPCGSGKTRLAEIIERESGIPCINKDSIKELLYDYIGIGDRDFSQKQGLASYKILQFIAGKFLLGGISIIIESNFSSEGLSNFLEPLKLRYNPKIHVIFCTAEPEVLFQRIRNRAANGERHPGHADTADFDEFRSSLGIYNPCSPSGSGADKLLRVDTTDFGRIDYDEILRFVADSNGMKAGI